MIQHLRDAGDRWSWACIPRAVAEGPAARTVTLRSLRAGGQATHDALIGLGLIGEVQAVDALLDALPAPPDAEHAAIALYLLTGADLLPAADDPSSRFSTDPAAWKTWWTANRKRFGAPNTRYRFGQPIGAQVIADQLRSFRVPMWIRGWMLEELRLRWANKLNLELDDLAARQLRLLAGGSFR